MRIQTKPVIALASGAILLGSVGSVFCQTAQAQSVIIPWTTVPLADVVGVATGPDALAVAYEVTENPFDGVYTYSYTVDNPSPGNVAFFTVDFNTGAIIDGEAAFLPGSITVGNANLGVANGANGITWAFLSDPISAGGGVSGTLTFQSDLAPETGNASATGNDNPPGPWASNGSAEQVAIPAQPPEVVPEPATTTLFALALLLLPFRSTILKRELTR
jgi:hypothetical protein